MNITDRKLEQNAIGRCEIGQRELTSDANIELRIGGHWILGNIEFWSGDYYWFSRTDGVPVVLHSGLKARFTWGGTARLVISHRGCIGVPTFIVRRFSWATR